MKSNSRPSSLAPTKPGRKHVPSKPGRPVADTKVEKRQLLLDTALALFARQGIAGTSLQQIAEQAHVTPALVHYYFGNKEQLVDVIVNECIIPIVDNFDALTREPSNTPLQTILMLTERMLMITAQLPWLPALWVREVLNEDGYLREWAQKHVAQQLSEHVSELTRRAQAQGQLNTKLDPRLMIVAMVGLTLFPLTAAPMMRSLPGNENISTEMLSQHMLELMQHGILNH